MQYLIFTTSENASLTSKLGFVTFDNIYSNITPSASQISSYTAPTDGWFYGWAQGSAGNNVNVYINGNTVYVFTSTTSQTGKSIGIFPLKKGQTISLTNGYFTGSSCFYGV